MSETTIVLAILFPLGVGLSCALFAPLFRNDPAVEFAVGVTLGTVIAVGFVVVRRLA